MPPLNQAESIRQAATLLEKISQEAVISSFQMSNSYFLILAMSEALQASEQTDPTDLMSCDFVAGLFKSNNQSYLIIEIDHSTHQAYSDTLTGAIANFNHPYMKLIQSLTERELQIAALVAQGLSNKKVATHLCISEWTVATHLRRIFMKLQVDSRAAMVYKCASLIQLSCIR